MTTPKFTPGPWGDPRKTILVRGATFLAHANYETAEGEANARLISAAPDMYEALRMVLDRGYVSDCIDEERSDHAMIVAALARANPHA